MLATGIKLNDRLKLKAGLFRQFAVPVTLISSVNMDLQLPVSEVRIFMKSMLRQNFKLESFRYLKLAYNNTPLLFLKKIIS